jgi:hypothetical protein
MKLSNRSSQATLLALLAASAGAGALLALTSRPVAMAPGARTESAPSAAPTAHAEAAVSSAASGDSRALRLELEALHRELASVKGKQHALDREMAEVGGRAPAGEKDDGDDVADAEEGAERIRSAIADLERRAAEEPRDPSWSAWAQGELERRFDAVAIAGAELVDVDCRRSLCQLALAFESELARDGGVAALPEAIPWDGQAFFHADPADPLVVFLYAGRDGYELPGFGDQEG